MKILPYNKHNLIKSNDLCVFLNAFSDPCPLCKYNLIQQKWFCLLCNLLYIDHFDIYILFIIAIPW